MSSGASVARAEPETALDRLEWSEPRPAETRADPRTQARVNAAEKRAEAKAKGYEGEACGECGNFTLVRNGTCLKCDTCGGTTGCS
jgi:ribonucleoside-diphosphate reductase alpha chain